MKSYLTGNPTDTENKPTLTIVVEFDDRYTTVDELVSIIRSELFILSKTHSDINLDGKYILSFYEETLGCKIVREMNDPVFIKKQEHEYLISASIYSKGVVELKKIKLEKIF